MYELAPLVSLTVAVIGGVVWMVRLEGRANSTRELFNTHETHDNERFSDLKDRLGRIEDKIDLVAFHLRGPGKNAL